MSATPTTLSAFVSLLRQSAPETPVLFRTPEGQLGQGTHITELKHALIRSIDCGGNLDSWPETLLQLLDGRGDPQLSAGKVAAILERSAQSIEGLGNAPLSVEAAPGNARLARYRISDMQEIGGTLTVALTPERASCKPADAMSCCA